jgi:hypothetical protein
VAKNLSPVQYEKFTTTPNQEELNPTSWSVGEK